ncbi:efflux transporter, RND family, MFP subunit [Myxococcus xanthus DK 1622]|uniref:Efflux transporter, RND family, MFP subunit n=1 Tax=Myxococcus xanthus (strain DK1622) TaxID=246197 RepID=Q1CWG3_MYXXD|nr:HlyD family efflux transporter periplasmic adaptor subunit [Myxococcus xanthus]ABF92255.1 efflux transporter, RND family, MFP subunit [Myxococcus xanthus DK 1622]NOJ51604.1 HlyD family efflux transporter periplasmic adaptor subunit [Myxococcus xanthus]QPM79414.1 HlyD family efflux transporter periplasmic adaptor subunit [Myxococcus xanthus]QVW68494.1 HlyD family efflux transporter periplasmic adaptor subunit [Myxococcus xanthus DZ2]UEO05393.1 HlyD family efflux transporter periplasmic adapt
MDIPKAKKPRRKPWVLAIGGACVLLLVTVGLSRLRPAAPTVERASVWLDTVKRGPMVRQVKGAGTLVPEYIRWLTADTAGRVERIHVRPGATVTADTLLLELSNPDVQLQALEAERQLASVEADLIQVRMELETQRLAQEAMVAALINESAEAGRRSDANEALHQKAHIGDLEMQQAREKAAELSRRLELERKKLQVVASSMKEQLTAQQGQVERLKAVARFRRAQVESMKVLAGEDGVLQDLPLELGQWVTPGVLLAKVVKPERLKAELRIAETQARDIQPGLKALVDTRNGVVEGQVARVAPAASQGTVRVEVSLPAELPRGARPDLTVEGTVELERLGDVLSVGRPAGAQPNATMALFRLMPGSDEAVRVPVQLGRGSVNAVEVLQGLQEGDQVVLSDMAAWDAVERVRLR